MLRFVTATGALESDDPKEGLEGFANVIKMETEKGEWCASFPLAAAR